MKQNFTVRQGALDGVEAFLSVAQHRSFRKAAAELGVTPSAISQAVRTLEARVGAALFIRTTRSVGLSEAGQRFHSRAKPAFEELVAASEVARDLGQRPAGLLRPRLAQAQTGGPYESLGHREVPGPMASAAVEAGNLLPLLEWFASMSPGVFLYYPGHREIMPKPRAFIDHVKSRSGTANKS